MDWFIIYIIIGLVIVIFCIGYLFGLNESRKLDIKYFEEYQKDIDYLFRLENGDKPRESDFISD